MYLCLKYLLKSGFQGDRECNYCIKKMLCSKQRSSIHELELHPAGAKHLFVQLVVGLSDRKTSGSTGRH